MVLFTFRIISPFVALWRANVLFKSVVETRVGRHPRKHPRLSLIVTLGTLAIYANTVGVRKAKGTESCPARRCLVPLAKYLPGL